jgi:hypothetical protein
MMNIQSDYLGINHNNAFVNCSSIYDVLTTHVFQSSNILI